MRSRIAVALLLGVVAAGCKKTTRPAEPSNTPATPEPARPTPPSAQQGPRVTAKDMEDIKIFIHDVSLASGQMPTPDLTYNALVKAGSPAAELVKNKAIVLTGTRNRDDVWAYEANALVQGGLVAGPNGVETLTAAQLKQRLGR